MSFYNLDENSPTIKQPKGLKIKLRQHQLTSICAMNELEKQGTIIIDKPDLDSGLYHTIKYKMTDIEEFTGSTFVMETNSAILADPVGTGKSFMLIGLILANQTPPIHDRFILGTDHYSVKMITVKESEKVNLIVVPHNLVNQWAEFIDFSKLDCLKLNTESDFDVFFDTEYVIGPEPDPDCPLVLYRICRNQKLVAKQLKKIDAKNKKKGGSKTKKTIASTVYEKRKLNPKKVKDILETKQVIVLNVNRYRLFKQIFRSTRWARVIIDEMDSAKIPVAFDEFGNFNWFVTATPTAIFYKSCRRYVNKIFGYNTQLLNYFTVKNKQEYVDSSMVLPKPYVFMVNALLHRVVSAIQDLIPTDVLQLINAGNMKEAITKLNCEADTEENIVKVLTEKIKNELHNLKQELSYVQRLRAVDEDAHNVRVARIQTDIDRCQTRLDTVHERMNSINDECCFICADEFDTPAILNCCKSVFCLKCLLGALKAGGNKCPYCRIMLKSNKDYHVIGNKSKSKQIKSEEKPTVKGFKDMDKAEVLEKILLHISKNDPSPRILIFSDYAQTFEKIIKNIAKAKLQYELLSGIPAHITNVINQFKDGTTNILMLDSQHYGSGLNLQDANYLILYHRMTAELETQVIGRAQRFGRTTPLKVIYLVNESENQTTKLSTNPCFLQNTKELFKIFDVKDTVNDKGFEENIEDSDQEPKNKPAQKKHSKTIGSSKTKKKNNQKKKSLSKKHKKIEDNDDDDNDDDDDDDLENLDLPVVKNRKKKKKYVEV